MRVLGGRIFKKTNLTDTDFQPDRRRYLRLCAVSAMMTASAADCAGSYCPVVGDEVESLHVSYWRPVFPRGGDAYDLGWTWARAHHQASILRVDVESPRAVSTSSKH